MRRSPRLSLRLRARHRVVADSSGHSARSAPLGASPAPGISATALDALTADLLAPAAYTTHCERVVGLCVGTIDERMEAPVVAARRESETSAYFRHLGRRELPPLAFEVEQQPFRIREIHGARS